MRAQYSVNTHISVFQIWVVHPLHSLLQEGTTLSSSWNKSNEATKCILYLYLSHLSYQTKWHNFYHVDMFSSCQHHVLWAQWLTVDPCLMWNTLKIETILPKSSTVFWCSIHNTDLYLHITIVTTTQDGLAFRLQYMRNSISVDNILIPRK